VRSISEKALLLFSAKYFRHRLAPGKKHVTSHRRWYTSPVHDGSLSPSCGNEMWGLQRRHGLCTWLSLSLLNQDVPGSPIIPVVRVKVKPAKHIKQDHIRTMKDLSEVDTWEHQEIGKNMLFVDRADKIRPNFYHIASNYIILSPPLQSAPHRSRHFHKTRNSSYFNTKFSTYISFSR
jgi:hypothetical protein